MPEQTEPDPIYLLKRRVPVAVFIFIFGLVFYLYVDKTIGIVEMVVAVFVYFFFGWVYKRRKKEYEEYKLKPKKAAKKGIIEDDPAKKRNLKYGRILRGAGMVLIAVSVVQLILGKGSSGMYDNIIQMVLGAFMIMYGIKLIKKSKPENNL